jgi:hypothetical protein
MAKSNKILFIGNGSEDRIEWHVMKNAYQNLKYFNESDVEILNAKTSFFRVLKSLFAINLLIVGSPLFLNSLFIIIAYARGCKLYAFIWDFYPVRIDGKYYKFGIKRYLKDRIENLLLFYIDKLIIPSRDFEIFYPSAVKLILPFWPKIDILNFKNLNSCINKSSGMIKIVFAGQVNETRGLAYSISLLKEKIVGPFVIYIASPTGDLEKHVFPDESVVILGELNNSELIELYRQCNFGLVSLSVGFNGPAFPSKTFDYLSAGLPIIYSGPYLEDYLSMIIGSGVGVDISSLITIDEKLFDILVYDFPKKIKKFENLACFDMHGFKNLIIKDDCDELQK